MKRSRRFDGQSEAGSWTSAATRPSWTWRGCSTLWCRVGSITMDDSTSRPCTRHSDRSTGILLVGLNGSISGCGAIAAARRSSWRTSLDVSPTSLRTGGLACGRTAGQWELDEPRGSRPVLRAPGGATPPGDSPGDPVSDRSPGPRGLSAVGGDPGTPGVVSPSPEDPAHPTYRRARGV